MDLRPTESEQQRERIELLEQENARLKARLDALEKAIEEAARQAYWTDARGYLPSY